MLLFLLIVIFVLTEDDPTIRFIIEVVHHGARSSPVTNFNTSTIPWDNNHKHGELTNTGERQGYLLGRAMREKYIYKASIIEEKYDDYQIIAKAAPYNAAVMSAIAHLTGLYTPGVGDVLSEMEQNIAIPPVEQLDVIEKEANQLKDAGLPMYTQIFPVHAAEGNNDWLFSTLSQCNIIKYIWANFTNSSLYKELNEKHSALFSIINSKAGTNISSMMEAYLLYDDLICDIADAQVLANKFKFDEETMKSLETVANEVWKYFIFGNSTVIKATITHLFNEWIKYFNDVVSNDNNSVNKRETLNYALYVTDASLIFPILNLYGRYMNKPISFADNIVIQMGTLQSNKPGKIKNELKDYEISAFYNGQIMSYQGNLWVPADRFVDILKENSFDGNLVDWCNYIPPIPPVVPPSSSKTKNIVALLIEVGVLACLVIACFSIKNYDKPADIEFVPAPESPIKKPSADVIPNI